eukprot:569123-Amphidinium_carterae.1
MPWLVLILPGARLSRSAVYCRGCCMGWLCRRKARGLLLGILVATDLPSKGINFVAWRSAFERQILVRRHSSIPDVAKITKVGDPRV